MFSQQSSLRGTRTALMCQLAMALIEAASLGPSKMPQPWMQAYSVPERSTPSSRIRFPRASRSWLPDTRSASPGGGEGARVGAGVGLGVGLGAGVAVGAGEAAPSVGEPAANSEVAPPKPPGPISKQRAPATRPHATTASLLIRIPPP